MHRLSVLIVAALLLAGCDPAPRPVSAGAIVGAADARVAEFERRFIAMRAFAELLLPLLPTDRAAQIRAAADRVELALRRIHAATTVADRVLAADEVRRALDAYASFTGG